MFAYCLNSPVNCIDDSGAFALSIAGVAVIGVSAALGGFANAISVKSNGGSLQDCLIAGLVGGIGGAIGGAITVVSGYSSVGSVVGRGVATFITDLGTNLALNGSITGNDVALAAFDATSDMVFSTIVGGYNAVPGKVLNTTVGVAIDAGIDISQNELFNENSYSNTSKTSTSTTATTGKKTKDYAKIKVGRLIGAI